MEQNDEEISAKIFCARATSMGFDVTFWACAGMRTEIREAAENSTDEIFRAMTDRDRARLIFNLFNDRGNREIFSEDLEYKKCPIDLTLTGM
jgi:hypothetical protein